MSIGARFHEPSSMSRRPALPISLYVTGRRVAVFGDGPGAREREARLLRAGAEVVRLEPGDPGEGDALSGCAAAFIQPDGPPDAACERVAKSARAHGCLVYVHDRPELSDFAMPAIARRGPLQLAISTDAVAPALARRLREQLERLLEAAGDELDALIDRLATRRRELPSERRGELYAEASRLHVAGRIRIDGDDE